MSTETRSAVRMWRVAKDVYLDECMPLEGEVERWETGICGPHPCRMELVKFRNGTWGAVVDGSRGGANPDPWVAIDSAAQAAEDSLRWRTARVASLNFEWAHEEFKPR